MPEYIEYVWFARFLEIMSLFVGPVIVFSQRKRPDGGPVHLARNVSHGPLAEQVLSDYFKERSCHMHWFPYGKNLICQLSTLDGDCVWLRVFLGTQGYPYIRVRA